MERKSMHLQLTVATLSNLNTCYLLTYCRSSADSSKLKYYDCVCDSQSPVPVLSQINLVQIFPHHFFDVHFNITFRSTLTSTNHFIVFRFRGRRHQGVDGRIILRWIFKKRDGAWTGLIWLGIGKGGGLL
jgi:hypothetical protein